MNCQHKTLTELANQLLKKLKTEEKAKGKSSSLLSGYPSGFKNFF